MNDDLALHAADVHAITNLVHQSFYLIDCGRWSELAADIFATEEGGLVPEADFGYAVWRGSEAVQAGFDEAMPRFEAAVHGVTNLHISIDGDGADARYYVHGWHWFTPEGGEPSGKERNADFLVLGVMTDRLVRQDGLWRVLRRRLRRMGPGMAVGGVQPWLAGLGGASSSEPAP